MNKNIFNIDYKKLVIWLLPKPIRKPVHVLWLMALLSPLTMFYNLFLAFRTSVLYFLDIDSTVCKLQKLLNDRYDSQLRRIVIVDGAEFDPVFIYQREENKPVFLYQKAENKPAYLYTKAETGATTVDFVIKVPVFVVIDVSEVQALVRRFKLPSKTFKVQFV